MSRLFVSAAFGLSVSVVALILLPEEYGPSIFLCLSYALTFLMALYLNALPDYISKEHVHILTVQLVAIAILTPWIGLTKSAVSTWFVNYFFAIFVVLPFVYEIVRNIIKRREKPDEHSDSQS